jgi:HAD superfamily hydrolase (TIGR01459 family)
MEWIDGIGAIAGRFTTVFVDAYGVLHEGAEAFPGAADTLRRLREGGLRIVVLTNSAGRADAVAERLAEAGISPDFYHHVMSGGELAWQYISRLNAVGEPPRLLIMREGSWPGWLDDLPNPVTRDVEEAELMLAAGMPYCDEADARACGLPDLLRSAAARGLRMVVADPDETYRSRGKLRLGPGWIGSVYTELGGAVVPFGKPHAAIFDAAMAIAGNPAPSDVLMVGDNLATDVAGASGSNLHSLLILERGVHAGLSADELSSAALRTGAFPNFTSATFVW